MSHSYLRRHFFLSFTLFAHCFFFVLFVFTFWYCLNELRRQCHTQRVSIGDIHRVYYQTTSLPMLSISSQDLSASLCLFCRCLMYFSMKTQHIDISILLQHIFLSFLLIFQTTNKRQGDFDKKIDKTSNRFENVGDQPKRERETDRELPFGTNRTLTKTHQHTHTHNGLWTDFIANFVHNLGC